MGVQDTLEGLIHRLYACLNDSDGDGMAACYTPDARFVDPAFGELQGDRVGGMWRMLTSQGSRIEASVSDIEIADGRGRAFWVARYTFGPTGRDVENRVAASYRFRDGLIADHVDRFSMWRWSRQALGPVGLFFGWSPVVARRVRHQALRSLDSFISH